MKPEVVMSILSYLKFIPGVPPFVITLIEVGQKVDTPEELWGIVNEGIAKSPIPGEKS